MKQVSNTQNSLVTGSTHSSIITKRFFSKYPVFFLPAFFIILFTSCKKNDLDNQKNEMVTSALTQGKTRCVPFKGSFTTMDEMTQAGTDANPIQKDHLTGKGQATELGNASMEVFAEGDITIPFPALVTSTGIFTAANGDKIYTTAYGYVQEPSPNGDLHLTGQATITGGTGRFTNATGTFVSDATGNIFHPEGGLTFTGSICY